MFRSFFTLSIPLISFVSALTAEESFFDIRKELAQVEQKISKNPSAENYLRLAILHEKSQHHELAIRAFLQGLDIVEPISKEMDEQEGKEAMEGLELYINHIDLDTTDVLSELRTRYEPMLIEHPDWDYLYFFLAIINANDYEFVSFYKHFFRAYKHYPNSFLALRTRALLHMKLYEHHEDKEKHRQLAMQDLKHALELDLRETGALRLLLFTATQEERKDLLQELIPKVLERGVVFPRKDILLYVRWMLRDDLQPLARLFVAHARNWYQFSRSLKIAEQLINKSSTKTS